MKTINKKLLVTAAKKRLKTTAADKSEFAGDANFEALNKFLCKYLTSTSISTKPTWFIDTGINNQLKGSFIDFCKFLTEGLPNLAKFPFITQVDVEKNPIRSDKPVITGVVTLSSGDNKTLNIVVTVNTIMITLL